MTRTRHTAGKTEVKLASAEAVDTAAVPQPQVDMSLPVPDDEIPQDLRRRVLEGQRAAAFEEARRRREQVAQAARVKHRFRAERVRLLGEEPYHRYRAFIKTERRRIAEERRAYAAVGMNPHQRSAISQRSKARVAEFERSIGFDPEKLRDHRLRAQEGLKGIFDDASSARGGIVPGSTGRVPLSGHHDPSGAPTGGQLFLPPYNTMGIWTFQSEKTKFGSALGDVGNFGFTSFYFANDPSGSLGTMAGVSIQDADNWDLGFAILRAFFGFSFTMPGAGQLRVTVLASPFTTKHTCSLSSEFGDCTSTVRQNNSIMLAIPQAGLEARVTTSHFEILGETDGLFIEDFFTDSQPTTISLQPDHQFQAGETVFFWIGHETSSEMWVDDVNGFSEATFRWMFHSVTAIPV